MDVTSDSYRIGLVVISGKQDAVIETDITVLEAVDPKHGRSLSSAIPYNGRGE